MSELGNDAVTVETRGHVMLIMINRPEARNAVNAQVHEGVGDALHAADTDPEIRAVIVTGAGDKAFCAGADLVALSRGESLAPDDKTKQAWGFAGLITHAISKPMIACVNGDALGGGLEITLACDLAVAVDTARFGLPEAKRGLFAAAGGVFRLADQLPKKIALEMILTGDPISATRALELGLVNALAPRDGLLDAAFALAERIAVNAPLSVQASKRMAQGIVDGKIAREEAPWAQNRGEAKIVFTSADSREGPKAFAEKRAPVWKAK
ncbi:enoyl-CoA hydratase-related protein [Sphingomonas sp. SUN019]|uniref:enoyl-CoA hydratase-related protein n=1 Tax=Sphingomonas sp. SUN019 TaxID=2937788 RepID=UPI0021640EAB|nr:enoyl-CoA hydratase-related protein [Sphingomonas sp. SUN019]UVO50952.1 enoyl-CoA hydratase-related protein [Sphingomonas sp. SUN019]